MQRLSCDRCKPLRTLRAVPLLLLVTAVANAHIGSPDTFVQTTAGPYTLLLAAHPPATTPGALELDLHLDPSDHITAVTAALDAAAPSPLLLVPDGTASTSLWLQAQGPATHTLHIAVQGSRGPGLCTLTLPGLPSRPPAPRGAMAVLLIAALALVLLSFIPALRRGRKGLRWTAVVLLIAAAAIALLDHRPAPRTTLAVTLVNAHLALTLANPTETFADLVPDHGKLLHLFLVREPGHDLILHLHPTQTATARFDAALPAMPGGTYTLFADFYRANGANETASLRLTLPQNSHTASADPDDSTAVLPPIQWTSNRILDPRSRGVPHPFTESAGQSGEEILTSTLPSGYTLYLLTPANLTPLHATLFHVALLDPAGVPPPDMVLYLGMSAHAVVLRDDDRVFAHIHPGGTLPMAAAAAMPGMAASNVAAIPYGFPSPGKYRLYIQMKHGGIVETGAFDLTVR